MLAFLMWVLRERRIIMAEQESEMFRINLEKEYLQTIEFITGEKPKDLEIIEQKYHEIHPKKSDVESRIYTKNMNGINFKLIFKEPEEPWGHRDNIVCVVVACDDDVEELLREMGWNREHKRY